MYRYATRQYNTFAFFFLLWLLGSKATKEHEIQETETGTLCLLSVVLCSSLLPRRPVQQYRRHGRVWLLAVGTDNLFHLRFFLQVRCWVRLVIFVEGLVLCVAVSLWSGRRDEACETKRQVCDKLCCWLAVEAGEVCASFSAPSWKSACTCDLYNLVVIDSLLQDRPSVSQSHYRRMARPAKSFFPLGPRLKPAKL